MLAPSAGTTPTVVGVWPCRTGRAAVDRAVRLPSDGLRRLVSLRGTMLDERVDFVQIRPPPANCLSGYIEMVAAGEWAFIEYVQMKVARLLASARKLLPPGTRSSYGCYVKSGSVHPTKAVLLENEVPFFFYETPVDVRLRLRVLELPILVVNYA